MRGPLGRYTTITIGPTLLGAVKRCTSQDTLVLCHMQKYQEYQHINITRFKVRAIRFIIITNLSYQITTKFGICHSCLSNVQSSPAITIFDITQPNVV